MKPLRRVGSSRRFDGSVSGFQIDNSAIAALHVLDVVLIQELPTLFLAAERQTLVNVVVGNVWPETACVRR